MNPTAPPSESLPPSKYGVTSTAPSVMARIDDSFAVPHQLSEASTTYEPVVAFETAFPPAAIPEKSLPLIDAVPVDATSTPLLVFEAVENLLVAIVTVPSDTLTSAAAPPAIVNSLWSMTAVPVDPPPKFSPKIDAPSTCV